MLELQKHLCPCILTNIIIFFTIELSNNILDFLPILSLENRGLQVPKDSDKQN